jgi:hypothetical protein
MDQAAELGAAVAAVFGNDDRIAHSSSMALQAAAGEAMRDSFVPSLGPILNQLGRLALESRPMQALCRRQPAAGLQRPDPPRPAKHSAGLPTSSGTALAEAGEDLAGKTVEHCFTQCRERSASGLAAAGDGCGPWRPH